MLTGRRTRSGATTFPLCRRASRHCLPAQQSWMRGSVDPSVGHESSPHCGSFASGSSRNSGRRWIREGNRSEFPDPNRPDGLRHQFHRRCVVKRFVIDVGIGLGVVLLVMIAEALVQTLRLRYSGGDWPTSAEISRALDVEYLKTAPPAFLITAGLALLLKVRGLREGVRRGLIWAAVLAVSYLIAGISNITANVAVPQGILVDRVSLWVLLAATALGPIAVGVSRRPTVPVSARQVRDEEGSRR